MDPLQQLSKGIAIIEADRRRPVRKRTAKGGGNPGLVRQILDLDESSFHRVLAFAALVRIK